MRERVDVYVTRLVPPWFNVTVPIHGKAGTLVASKWVLGRRKLRKAFKRQRSRSLSTSLRSTAGSIREQCSPLLLSSTDPPGEAHRYSPAGSSPYDRASILPG